jgi:hypothetical protein
MLPISGTRLYTAASSPKASPLAGFQPRTQIVWVKQHFTLSRGDYH